jgi:hypothetical protein
MQYPTQILIPELIPRSSWFSNLRSLLSQEQWDIIRKDSYRAAGYRCEICCGKGEKWPVECHERWAFDDATGIQYLEGVIALCPMCHKVKHIGLAETRGEGTAAIAWMARVNGWPSEVAKAARDGAFVQWEERSRRKWQIDYSRAPFVIQQLVRAVVDSTRQPALKVPPVPVSKSKQLLRKMQAERIKQKQADDGRRELEMIERLRITKQTEATERIAYDSAKFKTKKYLSKNKQKHRFAKFAN